jgi:hypothetical protein
MEAPKWFLRELNAFDPELRIRWSPRQEMFQLERRVTRSLHPGTVKNDNWHDDYIRAQDGYILVAQIPPHAIARSIFDKLKNADLWAHGGWERVVNEIEYYEQLEEEKRDKALGDDIRSMSAEVHSILKIRNGRTVFNAGWVQ